MFLVEYKEQTIFGFVIWLLLVKLLVEI